MPARVWRDQQSLPSADGSSQYVWMESTDSIAPSDISLSRLSNSQGVLNYQTDAANLYTMNASPSADDFYTSILGGYRAGDTATHKKPLKHPYFPGMWATNIVSIKQKGQPTKPTATPPYAKYDVAELSILFQTVPFYIDKDPIGGFNPNWLSVESHTEAQWRSTAYGNYKFQASGLQVAEGFFVRRAVQKIHITIHQVPSELAFTDGDVYSAKPWAAQHLGKVNYSEFMKCETGNLIFDSVDVLPRGDFPGKRRYYDLQMIFIYDTAGWNKALNSDGTYLTVVTRDGSNPPFASVEFKDIFAHLNP